MTLGISTGSLLEGPSDAVLEPSCRGQQIPTRNGRPRCPGNELPGMGRGSVPGAVSPHPSQRPGDALSLRACGGLGREGRCRLQGGAASPAPTSRAPPRPILGRASASRAVSLPPGWSGGPARWPPPASLRGRTGSASAGLSSLPAPLGGGWRRPEPRGPGIPLRLPVTLALALSSLDGVRGPARPDQPSRLIFVSRVPPPPAAASPNLPAKGKPLPLQPQISADWLLATVFPFLPCGSAGKESACNAGDPGAIPDLGRSPGEENSYPLQYSGLENPMDSMVQGVAKSGTRLSGFYLTHLLVPEESCFSPRCSWSLVSSTAFSDLLSHSCLSLPCAHRRWQSPRGNPLPPRCHC